MSADIEIYKQKYENFRHFDKLRWQAPALALAITAGVFTFLARTDLHSWVVALLLIFLAITIWLCAFLMKRINLRIEQNRDALAAVAKRIGDDAIPESMKHGASDLFALFLRVVAVGCCVVAVSKFLFNL